MRGTRLTQRHRRPQAPAPNRHAAALAMGVPSLAAGARNPARARAGHRLRAALLLSARALLGASPAGLDAWLAAAPAALAGAGSLPAALPALEARAPLAPGSVCGSWLRPRHGRQLHANAAPPRAVQRMHALVPALGACWRRAAPLNECLGRESAVRPACAARPAHDRERIAALPATRGATGCRLG